MGIRVDRRKGSGELLPLFQNWGLAPTLSTLEYSDFDWTGRGPDGLVAVAVERKTIHDLIDSIESRRLSGHQMRGLAENYDYAYLLVEGIWRPNREGLVEIRVFGQWVTKQIMWTAIDGYLDSAYLRAGMGILRTSTDYETVATIANRYRRWQEDWDSHRSHDAIYTPVNPSRIEIGGIELLKRPVTLCERMACQIPGLERKARSVAESFGSAADMARCGWERWRSIQWKTSKGKGRFQEKTARSIVAALRSKGYTSGEVVGDESEDLELG